MQTVMDLDVQEYARPITTVNVSTVPQRSPFRYPGGKTWLIPTIRQWLSQSNNIATLIEPFAGGGIVGLTAAFERYCESVIMAELDPEVAAVWETILGDQNNWLANRILSFDLTIDNINNEFNKENKTIKDIAFCTILKNRTYHGGIITKGSGLLKNGENGRGILSRWYPRTLYDRIKNIDKIKNVFDFRFSDAFDLIEEHIDNSEAYFFIDPPYVKAAKRLYTFYDIDHERLFELVSRIRGRFLLTYDDSPEVRHYASKYNLLYKSIPMKTTHHLEKNELLITDNLDW
jgi:DNA adenine methylase